MKLTNVALILLAHTIYSMAEFLHLIPHSHNDLGWLKTIEEYYEESVKHVFTTVIEALEEYSFHGHGHHHHHDRRWDPFRAKRKFVYADIGFLKYFLNDQPAERDVKIARLKNLIARGQFEFVNGGMSQADSACTSYMDLADNWFYGMRYLQKNLEVEPVSIWQIDPFGTSLSHMYIGALFGFEYALINRITDTLKQEWAESQRIQLTYRLPYNRKLKLHIATTYSSPDGLVCDKACSYLFFDKSLLDSYLDPKKNTSNNTHSTCSEKTFILVMPTTPLSTSTQS